MTVGQLIQTLYVAMEEQKIPWKEVPTRFGISKRQALAFRRNPQNLSIESVFYIAKGLGFDLPKFELKEASMHEQAYEALHPILPYKAFKNLKQN